MTVPSESMELLPAQQELALLDRQNVTLAASVAERMIDQRRQLCLAESCTGGGVAEMVTRLPGSSSWFDCGWVTYSNLAKQALLGVPESVFVHFGAVSDACVRAMADGALKRSAANYAVAVSGVAGPGGGSPAKPVGTVWLGLAWRADDAAAPVMATSRFRFTGDRHMVRSKAIRAAMTGLLHHLKTQNWPEGDWTEERWPDD